MNINALDQALNNAIVAGRTFTTTNPENPNDWYPCGFVWLTYKCRKNAKESAILRAHGWRWDDYEKRYTFTMSAIHNTQSMNYKGQIARAMLASLKEAGFNEFGYRERID